MSRPPARKRSTITAIAALICGSAASTAIATVRSTSIWARTSW
ncbi:hypothetical protein [Yimella sp. cx-51]|nr:hypothetical protein [Yimella sp. cx-51]